MLRRDGLSEERRCEPCVVCWEEVPGGVATTAALKEGSLLAGLDGRAQGPGYTGEPVETGAPTAGRLGKSWGGLTGLAERSKRTELRRVVASAESV